MDALFDKSAELELWHQGALLNGVLHLTRRVKGG